MAIFDVDVELGVEMLFSADVEFAVKTVSKKKFSVIIFYFLQHSR